MINRQTIFASACATFTLAAACSSSGGASTSDGGGASSSTTSGLPNCKVYTACDVLTAADVNSVLSTGYDGGSEEDVNLGPIEQASCTYLSSHERVLFDLSCGGEVPPANFPGIEADGGHTTTPVSGLGQTAFAIDGTGLMVYVNSQISFTVNVFVLNDAGNMLVSPPDALDSAKALAAKALTRLP
jgi:hypothetical protein